MNHISLVCTVHEEAERANVAELHAILMRIQPEVIFLEVPAASFDDFYGACSRHNLESLAVRQYRNGRQVNLVPVDLPTPEREFFEDHEHLHSIVSGESSEYRQLLVTDRAHTRTYGFAYLNSEYCDKHWFDAYGEMLNTVRRLGNSRLSSIYESVVRKLDARDSEMMSGILSYCKINAFQRGVFLVGAAHRRRIIEMANEQLSTHASCIQWEWKVEV